MSRFLLRAAESCCLRKLTRTLYHQYPTLLQWGGADTAEIQILAVEPSAVALVCNGNNSDCGISPLDD